MTMAERRSPKRSDHAELVHDAAQALVDVWLRSNHAGEDHISPSQLRALTVVGRAGELTVGQLADALGAMVSSASRLCDRLVAAGYLARGHRPDNRRQIFVSLTFEGRQLLDQIREARLDTLRALIAPLTATEVANLLAGLHALQRNAITPIRRPG